LVVKKRIEFCLSHGHELILTGRQFEIGFNPSARN